MNEQELDDFIRNHIVEKIAKGERYEVSEKTINSTKRVVNKLLLEEGNSALSDNGKRSLVETIAELIFEGNDEDTVFRGKSRNKHIYGFDNFLGEGTSASIVKTLEKHGLGIDAVKGLALGRNADDIHLPSGISYDETLSKENGESGVIEDLIIRYKGETIYRYDRSANINTTENLSTLKPGYRGKGTFIHPILQEKIPYKIWVDKRGRKTRRDLRGRILPKKYFE